jgi:hypothetical protein
MTEPLPRRTLGVSRRKAAAPDPLPGSPSRDSGIRPTRQMGVRGVGSPA